MADDLASVEKYLDSLPKKARKALADAMKEQADDLADAIRDAAPEGATGKLKQSVRVENGRDDLDVIVKAGGPLTTTEIRTGSGQPYDHALAVEFGTTKMPAEPFFYSTYRARKDDITEALQDAVEDALK